MVKCTKKQIRRLKTALHWKGHPEQRQRGSIGLVNAAMDICSPLPPHSILTAASPAITSECVGARNIQSERFRTLTKNTAHQRTSSIVALGI
jgi:hypothetical protein